MCEQISDVPEKKSLLEKIGVKKAKELPFSAEKCWCETKQPEYLPICTF